MAWFRCSGVEGSMFCHYCGTKLGEGSVFCTNCGAKLRADMPQPQMGQPQMGQPQMNQPQMAQPGMGQPQMNQPGMNQPQMVPTRPGGGISTIFHAISANPSRGDVMELIVWIGLCLAGVLEMVAAVKCSVSGSAMALWIIMMLGNLGLAMILMFRLKRTFLLSAYGLFNLIFLIPVYKLGTGINGALNSVSPVIITLFIIDLVVAVALVILSAIQLFSGFRFGVFLVILSIVSVLLTLALVLCIRYMIPGGRISTTVKGFGFGVLSYLFGGLTYVFTLALTAVYTIVFSKGTKRTK